VHRDERAGEVHDPYGDEQPPGDAESSLAPGQHDADGEREGQETEHRPGAIPGRDAQTA
jgi:hypothetical protein